MRWRWIECCCFSLIVYYSCFGKCFGKKTKEIKGLKGVHFDIEPHVLQEWNGDGFIQTSISFANLLEKLNYISKIEDLELAIDVNCDLDGDQCNNRDCSVSIDGVEKQAIQHFIDRVDRLVLMAYFADSSEIIQRTSFEINYCDDVGKKSVVGINLSDKSIDSETLRDEGLSIAEEYLDDIWNEYHDNPSFSGFAIHHYGYWASLNPPPILISDSRQGREIYWWCSGFKNCNIYNESAVDELVEFSKTHGVTRVFIDAPAILALDPPTGDHQVLFDTISLLWNNDIESEMIFGRNSWALPSEHWIAEEHANNTIKFIQHYGSDVVDQMTNNSQLSDSRQLLSYVSCTLFVTFIM